MAYENKRGPGYWKLNSNLLYDLEYVKLVKQVIEEVKETNKEANPSLLWDTIEYVIRGHTIKFASNRKRRINVEIRDIETKLQNLQDDMQKPNTDFDTIIENMEVLKNDLKIILNERTQGAIVRSRTKWYEEGEKNSKYFTNLEKRQSSNKTINRLQLQDGTITENPQKILTEQRNFYMQLYTKLQSSHTPDFVNHLKKHTLTTRRK